MKTGIYKITCIVTNKGYIGSASDIEKRWCWHRHFLRLKKHHSPKLLRSWIKYGENNFIFQILELCDKSQLLIREQYWIDTFKSSNIGLNTSPYAVSGFGRKWTKESKQRASISAKRWAAEPEERKRRSDRAKKQHEQGILNSHKSPTVDTKQKISAGLKRAYAEGRLIPRRKPNLGVKTYWASLTPEQRSEVSRKHSVERWKAKS